MLAKQYRLPIQTTLGKKSRILKTPYFLIKIFPTSLPYGRAGIVASLKISKKAVIRNSLKRKFFLILDKEFLIRHSGKDFLIIANPRITELNQTELKNQVLNVIG